MPRGSVALQTDATAVKSANSAIRAGCTDFSGRQDLPRIPWRGMILLPSVLILVRVSFPPDTVKRCRMARFSWPVRPAHRRTWFFRPCCELLEDRLTPSTYQVLTNGDGTETVTNDRARPVHRIDFAGRRRCGQRGRPQQHHHLRLVGRRPDDHAHQQRHQ